MAIKESDSHLGQLSKQALAHLIGRMGNNSGHQNHVNQAGNRQADKRHQYTAHDAANSRQNLISLTLLRKSPAQLNQMLNSLADINRKKDLKNSRCYHHQEHNDKG